jgi:hypothetical protein
LRTEATEVSLVSVRTLCVKCQKLHGDEERNYMLMCICGTSTADNRGMCEHAGPSLYHCSPQSAFCNKDLTGWPIETSPLELRSGWFSFSPSTSRTRACRALCGQSCKITTALYLPDKTVWILTVALVLWRPHHSSGSGS